MLPPDKNQVGPRIHLASVPGGNLTSGKYSGKRFTTPINLSSKTGEYIFTDCDFPKGFEPVYGGPSVTRKIKIDHCRIYGGLWFENGGQKNWSISWSHIQSDRGTALRPKNVNNTTPTPFKVTDSIIEMTSVGSPSMHVTAMQDLGGCRLTFIRVKFIVPGPVVDGKTGQTAAITNKSNDTLFDSCDFLSEKAYYYSVYVHGDNVLFRNCRFAHPRAGYRYPTSKAGKVKFEKCTEFISGKLIDKKNFN